MTVLQSPEYSIILSDKRQSLHFNFFSYFTVLFILSHKKCLPQYVWHLWNSALDIQWTYWNYDICLLPPATKLGQGYVVSVILFTGGFTPLHSGIHRPPGPGTPPTREQTPPRADPPQHSAFWEIRATGRRYASYWNAILLLFCFSHVLLSSSWLLKEHMTPWVKSKIMFLFNELVPGFFFIFGAVEIT